MEQLRLQQHRDSTKRNYYAVWKVFNEFIIRLDRKPKSWENRLTLFIGHMIATDKQSSMVKSYISAVKAVLKSHGIKIAEDQYLLLSLTRACKLKNDRVKIRLPIQKTLLGVILNRIQIHFLHELNQPYLAILYKTIISTMYFRLFRISEVAQGQHQVLARDVHIGDNKKKFLFILRWSKTHCLQSHPQMVKILSTSLTKQKAYRKVAHNMPCPYQLLKDYSRIRGGYTSDVEPYFVYADKSPVPPRRVSNCLKNMLKAISVDPSLYGTHSLRSGRTCDLFQLGLSVKTIKKLG